MCGGRNNAVNSNIVPKFLFHQTFCDIKDLSYGKENVAISCVNGIDRQYPDYVEYSNQRIPAKGVLLNLDTDFLCGCDCTDYCQVRRLENTVRLQNICFGLIIITDLVYE